ncbi:ABC transporter substrate-binding protein [Bradyrhizobium sp. AUGA SZCCT0240]|uniref:ABC transporter substrate-binding protein n=1 Tax=Bradyrhizobium sp. AUGA SZCCT0240 TaxID=2807669 RepID=UPI001BA92AEB|nr:ABC transporter substrate-binding protein [Bradyrhizobium sp. AUGA SZCCT0240]MBR1252322.1 ABC transporter substrate-binding protein [Bradyrhizobium sp. AUGA SZCCT0240]
MRGISRRAILSGAFSLAAVSWGPRQARARNDLGVTETEIKLGTTGAYSGPVSSAAVYSEAQTAYFRMVNERGGINGRKVNLISLDNAFSPAKALEQTRRLVESDEVFAIAGSFGSAPSLAVQRYLNSKRVPNLFLTSGIEKFNDPKNFPWIVPFYPLYVAQGKVFGRYVLEQRPSARIAVHYSNDDLGRDFVKGIRAALGDRAEAMIVKELSHELSEPTIEAQMVELKASGADVLVQITQSKFAAQGIRKAAALDWRPLYIIAGNASSIGTTLVPAGRENSTGIVTARWERNVTDPAEADTPAVKEYIEFAKKYLPNISLENTTTVPGYNNAYMIEQVLKRCGDDLTRENLLKQATTIRGIVPPLFVEGIEVFNSPGDYRAVHNLQLAKFDGKTWVAIAKPVALDGL